jgi:signal transduction histidine kinase
MKIFGSANIKIALLIFGILIVIGTLVYTQILAKEILDRERDIANLYAKSIEFISNDENLSGEYNFIFNNVINSNTINFPIVVTDAKSGEPTFIKNLYIDSSQSAEDIKENLREEIERMDVVNKPIRVTYRDSVELSYVHYGQSQLVTRLETLPLVEIIVATVFIFMGYFGFNYIKRNEQSSIWVGLSKETAHQLGTPLSSLMGWNELIKDNTNNPEKIQYLSGEMSNDIDRLTKIANRFSKIGSKPDLKHENIYNILDRVKSYFEKRIPRLQTEYHGIGKKKVELEITGDKNLNGLINKELFEWVIENLTKNALDAIESSNGRILYEIHDKGREIIIDVTDTGKGLEFKYRKDIFRPGFSTKTRGWGLGLSLSKRIIETYHNGKLLLKESEVGKGSTFRIKLKKVTSNVKSNV